MTPDPTPWQDAEAQRLRGILPAGTTLEVHGSAASGDLDGWSDLDVRIALPAAPFDLAELYGSVRSGTEPWAWSDADGETGQVVRLVLRDGRRIDLRVVSGRIRTPEPPSDGAARFDLALAAARLGRGDRLVGLHLLFGVARDALVAAMLLRDRDSGSAHHRTGTGRDRLARELVDALSADPLGPETTLRVADLVAVTRAELDPTYEADWSGLRAVIARGAATGGTAEPVR